MAAEVFSTLLLICGTGYLMTFELVQNFVLSKVHSRLIFSLQYLLSELLFIVKRLEQ